MDKLILTLAVIPIAAAIGGFYYFGDESLLLRVIGLLFAAGLSIVIALRSQTGKATADFMKEARNEVRKVVWPTRKETAQTTMFVMVAVVIMGFCLWLLDMFLSWAVRFLTV